MRTELEQYRRASDRMRKLDPYRGIRNEAEKRLKSLTRLQNAKHGSSAIPALCKPIHFRREKQRAFCVFFCRGSVKHKVKFCV